MLLLDHVSQKWWSFESHDELFSANALILSSPLYQVHQRVHLRGPSAERQVRAPVPHAAFARLTADLDTAAQTA